MSSIKTQDTIVKGVIWSAIEKFSVQGIQFITSLVIARLILPKEFGLIAMIQIFLSIAQVFTDSGFSNALIQKQERTEKDFSTVFIFNFIVSIITYIILFYVSPLIANFYEEPSLTLIIRWTGLTIIFSSLFIIQQTRLTIALNFKKQARVSIIAALISGFAGIWLAYNNYGVWALVVQTLTYNIILAILFWIITKWYPKLVFSWVSFKQLFSFGSKLLVSTLLHSIYLNLYSLVIGKYYSATNVGYYNRMALIGQFPSNTIMTIVTKVIYPIQCEIQDNIEKLNQFFTQYLRMSMYIIFPLMIGLGVLAKPLVILILTDKWLPAVDYLQILCLAYMWSPVMIINNNILNVRGRSDLFLKAEIIKKAIALMILFTTLQFSVYYLCWGLVLYHLLDIIIIIHFTKQVIPTSYFGQLKQIIPFFALALSMGGVVYLSIILIDNMLLKLIIGSLVGVVYYFLVSQIFKLNELNTILSILQKWLPQKK